MKAFARRERLVRHAVSRVASMFARLSDTERDPLAQKRTSRLAGGCHNGRNRKLNTWQALQQTKARTSCHHGRKNGGATPAELDARPKSRSIVREAMEAHRRKMAAGLRDLREREG